MNPSVFSDVSLQDLASGACNVTQLIGEERALRWLPNVCPDGDVEKEKCTLHVQFVMAFGDLVAIKQPVRLFVHSKPLRCFIFILLLFPCIFAYQYHASQCCTQDLTTFRKSEITASYCALPETHGNQHRA